MKNTLKGLVVASLIAFTAGSALAYTQTYRGSDNDDIQLTITSRNAYTVEDAVDVQLNFIDRRTQTKPEGLGISMAVDNGAFRTVIPANSTRSSALASAGELSAGPHVLRFAIPDGCGSFYDYSRFGARTLFDNETDCVFEHTIMVGGSLEGCTDESATNYNVGATVDDGSCRYDGAGCIDPRATNYMPNASTDDGSCVYPPIGGTVGCTDPTARNYSFTATEDDGSCIPYVFGCTDRRATNFNASAEANDGSCLYPTNVSESEFECSLNNDTWFECEGRTFTLRTSETPIYVRTEPRNAGTWSDWCTGEIGNGVQAQFTDLTNNGDNAQVNFTFARPGALYDMVLCLDPDSDFRAQSHQNIKLKVIDMTFREN